MTSIPQETGFEQCALASGLLTQDALDRAREALRTAGVKAAGSVSRWEERLADQLIEMGHLNTWQAKQLLNGRTKFTLGPYRIVDSLGRGGMGQVFKGEHTVLGRVVAVKVLPRHKSSPEAVANFMREMRAQAKLDHENLVRALDAGEDGSVYYLVTEYVSGTDLRKLIRRRGPLRMHAAAAIVVQAAAGLQHAHERGLVHRDVKPGNIMVSQDGQAKLLDLGLAGPLGTEAVNDPRHGRIVGTVDYLSPDHIREPKRPTPAWDIYSLGCTLYYAVTGKVPFPGGTTGDKVRAHLELRPLDPRRLNPELDPAFVDVMADMMAKEPADRIPSAQAVIEALSPWATGPVPLDSSAWLRANWDVLQRQVMLRRGRAGPVEASALAETKPSFTNVLDSLPRAETNSEAATSHDGPEPLPLNINAPPLYQDRFSPSLLGPILFFVVLPPTIVAIILAMWRYVVAP